ncbi:methyl-accepting chemotaxis protein [Cytobacillus firmus]|uniref:Methyl-accepting chemotaxis protein TlpA n=1 Tax=Cytobacillus firmus DS1 TaxID=1307436 RepID=W7L2W5_CYTFI|nr:methyl-accepting chemotaxis protein [Cytobacillus firmus]EWG09941.1 methyl-accepting chemotaxis protein TlpA [Cytobacillus firmus DS1]
MKNIRIGNKLLMLIFVSLLFIIGVGLTGFLYMERMAENTELMYEERLIPIKQMETVQINNRKIDTYIMEMMVTNDPERTKKLVENIETNQADNNNIIEEYGKNRSDYVMGKLKNYEELIEQYSAALKKTEELAISNKNEEAYAMFTNSVKPLRSEIGAIVDELTAYNDQRAQELNETNSKSFQTASFMMLGLLGLAILICGLTGFIIYKLIVPKVKNLQELMKTAEEGDLRAEFSYSSKDEIGQLGASFNSMMKGLRSVIAHIQESSELLASSSEEMTASATHTSKAAEHIVASIQEVSSGAEDQLVSVEKMTQVIEEMTAAIQQVASGAQEASSISILAATNANDGSVTVKEAVLQMHSINSIAEELVHSANKLGRRSDEIGSIIEVITAIASQTNLLSLNAAIEAARAGEQGRGFAVVAGEVGKLADQSASSAKQIEELIKTIQEETRMMITSMDAVKKEVLKGIDMVSTAGQSFESIQNSTENASNQIHEVSIAAQQISAGTDQMVQSSNVIEEATKSAASGTHDISAATQEQLATMEEMSATAASLSDMADELQLMIKKFKI